MVNSVRNLLLVSLLMAILAGCATAPTVGVRPSFKDIRVSEVTVVDFYSTSSFGLSDEDFDAQMATYEAATLAWLGDAGVRVFTPDELQQRLKERSLSQTFSDGVVLNRSLHELFEPNDSQTPLESQTIKAIAARGGFPADALFFAEVVYQTVGTCDGTAKEFNPRAVVLEPIGDAQPPAPCVVSHLDAKLVDSASGATMWHNRLLVEQWFAGTDADEVVDTTITTVVEMTLDGSGGLRPLLGRATDQP